MSYEIVDQDYITKVITANQVIGKVFSFRCKQSHSAILERLELGKKLLPLTESFCSIEFNTIKEGYCYVIATPSLQNEEPPTINQSFIVDLAKDLDFLHGNKLIHGDIRLANILSSVTRPKVIDFEPVLRINSLTPNTKILKARHIHPDDFEVGRISALSDRLGFGIIAQVLQGYQHGKDTLIKDLSDLCRTMTCREIMELPLLRRSLGPSISHKEMDLMNYLDIA